MSFHSGFVAIIGRPNVGKSTLMNALVGEKVAIVSDKPQTTRNRIMGVATDKGWQIVFLDTPGLHKPRTRLGEYMVKSVQDAMDGIDVLLGIVPLGLVALGLTTRAWPAATSAFVACVLLLALVVFARERLTAEIRKLFSA